MTVAAQWLNSNFADFDLAFTLLVHRLYDLAGWFFSPLFELLHILASPLGCTFLLLFLFFFVKKARPFIYAMMISVVLGVLFNNFVIKLLVARPRPYVDEGSVFYQLWMMMGCHTESDLSFPSGHATGAFAMMLPIFLLGDKRRSWLALVYAFLVMISRVYLVVHYPTDVIAGAVVGTLAALIGTPISQKLPRVLYTFEFFPKKQQGKHIKQ